MVAFSREMYPSSFSMKKVVLSCFLFALSVVPTSAETLTTTFAGGNANNGIMFDVVADRPLTISAIQFASDDAAAGSLEIYVKAGTHVGSEGTASAWNLLVTAPYAAGPVDVAKPAITLPGLVTVQPGQPIAFYLRQTANNLSYTNGDGVGTVEADDGTMRILEGTAVSATFGFTTASRIPNVTIHYSPAPDTLTTTFDGGNSNKGIVFDVVAKNALNLRSLQVPLENAGTHSLYVYTRLGTHVGFEGDSTAWTLLGVRSVQIVGADRTTVTFEFPEALPVPTGGTRAFMIGVPTAVVRYSNGGAELVGNIEAEDSNLRILKGFGMNSLFGATPLARVPNVAIRYSDVDGLAPRITLAGPKRIKATGSRAKIYAVASDDVAVDRVDATYKRVKGTTLGSSVKQKLPLQPSGLFFLNLKLAPGRNVASFQATDRAGRKSAPVKVTVTR
jgi:hypothetical protein